MDIKLRPLNKAWAKKLKIHDINETIDMVAYMEEALKIKIEGLEGQEKGSKLFSICSISKDPSREQIGGKNGKYWRITALLPTVALPLPLSVGFCGITSKKSIPYLVW
ncbi:hypothetical protein M9H77_13932 [Catharanthus roseus]|uniref:Uncharacterized protein n=1 Tax=Catharanthus roseus TaxID=4058 RepID=A0ACC0BLS7_CATRO|nr:hypothetical protein M9H77_13932 [Catharanthus roseus]